ncbi:MAG TPA: hypothetical protein VF013_05885 [Candidatus Limnocylindria bacterium]
MAWPLLAVLLAACSPATPTSSAIASHHADPQAERVKSALADEFGMAFEPAGPHHELGKADDGVQLDLVGVPVEEVVLSLPADDREVAVATGLAYLPHLRDLLHGADPVWDAVAASLACRRDAAADCPGDFAQGNLEARFTGDETEYLVLVIAVR